MGNFFDDQMRQCPQCLEVKPKTEFYGNKNNIWTGDYSKCKVCHCINCKLRYDAMSPERKAERYRKDKIRAHRTKLIRIGLTEDDYRHLMEAGCASCGDSLFGREPRDVAIDHDHRCCPVSKVCKKCFRGILCGSCNKALGFLREDPNRARQLIIYMESHGRMSVV